MKTTLVLADTLLVGAASAEDVGESSVFGVPISHLLTVGRTVSRERRRITAKREEQAASEQRQRGSGASARSERQRAPQSRANARSREYGP